MFKTHAEYMQHWKAQGHHALPMERACGCGPLEVTAPPNPGRDQWDSLMSCPDCGALSMTVRTHTEARSLVPPA